VLDEAVRARTDPREVREDVPGSRGHRGKRPAGVIGLLLLLALLAATGPASSARRPGGFSTPFANPATPTIMLRVGQSLTYTALRWRPNQRVSCTGDGDALGGEIPGYLGVAPLVRSMRLRYPLVLRLNHTLELSLVMTADHSITVSCSPHP
jgi:hypothetical protein